MFVFRHALTNVFRTFIKHATKSTLSLPTFETYGWLLQNKRVQCLDF
jgi:hypothetical protein